MKFKTIITILLAIIALCMSSTNLYADIVKGRVVDAESGDDQKRDDARVYVQPQDDEGQNDHYDHIDPGKAPDQIVKKFPVHDTILSLGETPPNKTVYYT